MNIRHRLVMSVVGGMLVATALVGSAVALPHVLGRTTVERGTMMRASAISRHVDRPNREEMRSFMEQYRTSDGRIDVNRMHADVTHGALRRGPAPTRGFSGSGMMGR